MRHIYGAKCAPKRRSTQVTLCGAMASSAECVVSAMESDCEACRGAINVAPPSQKGCEVRPTLSYTPEPRADADEIMEEALRNRDGR